MSGNNFPPSDGDLWDVPSQPSVEQYPGRFPPQPPKDSAWSRRRVGVAAGVAGLLLGLVVGAVGSHPEEVSAAGKQFAAADVDAAVADAVKKAKDDFAVAQEKTESQGESEVARVKQELTSARAQAKDDLRAAAAAAKARQRSAVAKAVAAEKRRADARVAAAKAAASKPQPAVASGAGDGSGTDPQFDWCYEANDAGYGPYHEGSDPEYDWYDDADGDGIVCEP